MKKLLMVVLLAVAGFGAAVLTTDLAFADGGGKTTICHATGSASNPYVTITISNSAVEAHRRHQDREDIIPAPAGGCPGPVSTPPTTTTGPTPTTTVVTTTTGPTTTVTGPTTTTTGPTTTGPTTTVTGPTTTVTGPATTVAGPTTTGPTVTIRETVTIRVTKFIKVKPKPCAKGYRKAKGGGCYRDRVIVKWRESPKCLPVKKKPPPRCEGACKPAELEVGGSG